MPSPAVNTAQTLQPTPTLNALLPTLLPLAAIGYSLLYLLFGGGFFGAVVIFIIAKIFRK